MKLICHITLSRSRILLCGVKTAKYAATAGHILEIENADWFTEAFDFCEECYENSALAILKETDL